jgi:type I restriction enzyme S subunit
MAGEVPAHWGIARLGFECETIVPMRDKPEHLGGEIPWIRIEDFNGKFIGDSKSDQGVSQETVKAMNLKVLPVGAVLCSCSCSMGATAIVAKPLVTNQTFIGVVPSKTFSSDYLYFFFHTAADHLDSIGTGAIQTYLSRDDFRRLRLPCPPFPEQTKIAAFLDRETAKIDGLIGDQRRLMELLKEKRQAVISHAVTKGLNPDALMKPSGIEWLGEVPAHWELNRIANVFREIGEPGTAELPILSVSIHHGVSDKEIDEDKLERKVTRSDDRSKYKQVSPGDLVYNMMRAWQGGFGTVTVMGMVSPAYVVARPVKMLETAYIEHLLRTPQAIEQMRRHSRGVTDFRLRLYWDEFKNIRVALPPIEEATVICTKISEMEGRFSAMSAEAQRAIDLLQERRTAMISAAVTGQIDVRALSPAKAMEATT